MSRRTDIEEAGRYAGLCAAHWACHGEAWREVGDYRVRTDDMLGTITLNDDEFNAGRSAAVKPAPQYNHIAFNTPGKTLIPEDEASANLAAR